MRTDPAGSVVALGGSVSVVQSGLLDALRGMDIRLLDRNRPGISAAEVDRMRVEGFSADVFIASSNAITSDGRLVNIDGSGNRVACMMHGPAKVVLLAGMNKVVASLEDAMSRIRNHAAPLNAVRLDRDTPCARTGFCDEPGCRPPGRICGQVAVIENSKTAGRMTVVLTGEHLGF